MQNNLVNRKFLDYMKQEIESVHTFIWQTRPLLSKQKNNSFLFLKEVSFASDRFSGDSSFSVQTPIIPSWVC